MGIITTTIQDVKIELIQDKEKECYAIIVTIDNKEDELCTLETLGKACIVFREFSDELTDLKIKEYMAKDLLNNLFA